MYFHQQCIKVYIPHLHKNWSKSNVSYFIMFIMSEVDVGDMAVEIKPSQQQPSFLDLVTDSHLAAV